MARSVNRLSARLVATIKEPGRYADGAGLYLLVTPKQKSWVFVFIRHGKRREMGLGSAATVSLADARRKAEEARRMLADGVDPLDAKREAERDRRVPTFGDMADTFIAAMEPGWKNSKHRDQWKMTLGRVRDEDGNLLGTGYCLELADKRVDEISTEDVLSVLKPIWSTKPETASRVRGRIEAVLDAAKAAGYRSGENPARWRGHLSLLLPKRQKLRRGHHPAMPYKDVPAFVARLRAAPGMGARALEFLILTAARSGEVRGATWAEIDLDGKVWTVPGQRMKGGKAHRVPLTDRALEILAEVAILRPKDDDGSALVFPSTKPGKPLSDMTLTAVMRRLGAGAYTVHGFRSSFRDWAGDVTSFPREVAEAALAHVVQGVEGAYRRSDAFEKRRQLMTAWANFLHVDPAGNVVVLRR